MLPWRVLIPCQEHMVHHWLRKYFLSKHLPWEITFLKEFFHSDPDHWDQGIHLCSQLLGVQNLLGIHLSSHLLGVQNSLHLCTQLLSLWNPRNQRRQKRPNTISLWNLWNPRNERRLSLRNLFVHLRILALPPSRCRRLIAIHFFLHVKPKSTHMLHQNHSRTNWF